MESKINQNEALNLKLKETESHKCSVFTLDSILKDNQLLTYYTGFDNSKMLNAFLNFINPENDITFSRKLSISDQIFVVLCKLRQGFDNIDLSFRFNVSSKHISKIFVNWVNIIYFRLGSLNIFPSRDVILNNSPPIFKEKYPKTFMILDCTELKIESPSDLVLQSQSYSTYKSHNTMKGLVGCDPNGGLLFVSSLFTGSISDKKIVEQSGLLELLSEKLKVKELLPNDAVMFDKGFNIVNEIQALKLAYNVPPMASELQFPEEEVFETRSIASVRVHVERLIRRFKSFKILSRVVPITLMPHLNQIWTICCILSGFRTVTKNADSGISNDSDSE